MGSVDRIAPEAEWRASRTPSLTRERLMRRLLTHTEQIVHDFIVEQVLYDRQIADLDPKDLLLEDLLDSLAVMQIVAFCEQAFDINITEEELLPANFASIRSIGQLIERLVGERK
jgi:acyl carrier protein